jgi:hypothetical protein
LGNGLGARKQEGREHAGVAWLKMAISVLPPGEDRDLLSRLLERAQKEAAEKGEWLQ